MAIACNTFLDSVIHRKLELINELKLQGASIDPFEIYTLEEQVRSAASLHSIYIQCLNICKNVQKTSKNTAMNKFLVLECFILQYIHGDKDALVSIQNISSEIFEYE